jgi:NAD(P)-dependent dehydrogenase (short-subunit alcohol dehydrogenase family)
MKHEFLGKAALVIGGTTGIGASVVNDFAANGCDVAFAGLEREEGTALEQRINAGNLGRALFVQTDVRDEGAVEELVAKASDRFGRIHYAVNNAGVEGPFGPLQEVSEADFDRVMETNVKGVWLGMKYQIRHMLAHGGGAIVNTASSAGVVSIPQIAIYSASKHAIVGLSKAAALEQARSGIRINVVAPGPVKTGLLSRMVAGHVDLESIADAVPMGRISDPPEIASAILWLCSDSASFVTGHTLLADGGLTIA